VIVSAQGASLQGASDLRSAIQRSDPERGIRLQVVSGASRRYVILRLS
jgi:hypothetical protein